MLNSICFFFFFNSFRYGFDMLLDYGFVMVFVCVNIWRLSWVLVCFHPCHNAFYGTIGEMEMPRSFNHISGFVYVVLWMLCLELCGLLQPGSLFYGAV